MLVIRDPQVQALAAVHRQKLEDELVAHVRERLPDHHAVLGEAGTRRGVRDAMEQASAQGLETKLGVTVFVRLSFVFGLDFAEEQPWARQTLEETAPLDEGERVKRLGEAAADHVRRVLAGAAEG